MKKNRRASEKNFFEYFATKVTKATGTTPVFISAFIVVLAWAASGPFFDFSETWQLVINTGTTIITFLMVFLIQKTQNKDSLALHLKLNELVASSRFASNRLVDVEDLTEEEMEVLKKYYMKLSDLSEEESSLIISHSIDEAQVLHREKRHSPRKPDNGSGRGRQNASKRRNSMKETASASTDTEAKPKAKRRKPRRKPTAGEGNNPKAGDN